MTKPNKHKRNRIVYKKVIKYISNIRIDEDGDKFPEYAHTRVVESGLKLYDGITPILADISRCSYNLIMFCGEEMDNDGIIRNDSHTKAMFNKLMEEYTKGKTTYADTSINIAFSELTKRGLLLSKGKGLFKVNPMYIWRNGDSNRHAIIRKELELDDTVFELDVPHILEVEDHDREKD